MTDSSEPRPPEAGRDFVRTTIERELASGARSRVVTRFPPEPNGFLHIGHAKAICLDFGVAEEYGGQCNLRFDDTNPQTEDPRYVESIKQDVRWLGFEWGEHEYYASDYFEQLHDWAVQLIRKGVAYVDDLSEEEIREYRGTVTTPGREGPCRERPVEENLDLFARMRAGEFADGSKVLRAKIDMAHPNMKMRDPLMYRIRHAHHYRQGDDWKIYPFYDWAHGQSDAIEGITYSLCTLEFESNRELYDWYLEQLELEAPPRQYEFARLNVEYTITSKRKLLRLVEGGHVEGWDDPRMPTIAGLRRRGVPAAAIRRFCDLVGISKSESRVDVGMLEFAVRDQLNTEAPRVMCVLDPLKVVITSYPEAQVEMLEASHWPHDVPREGWRQVPFSRELYIERSDFMQEPPKSFYRLAPGAEVRLRYGYVVRCDEVVRDEHGEVLELRCTHDPGTRGGAVPDGRRVKGTIHWVSAPHAVALQVRLYDRLFAVPAPGASGEDFLDDLNAESLVRIERAMGEPGLAELPASAHVQFERHGYFYTDPEDSRPGAPVFNRVVTLRDSWARKTDEPVLPPETEVEPTSGGDPDEPRKRRKRSPVEIRAAARAEQPELAAAYERLRADHGIDESTADVLTGHIGLVALFESAVQTHPAPASVAKWVVNQVLRATKEVGVEALPFDGHRLGDLVALVDSGAISTLAAKEVFAVMVESGGDPAAIVRDRDLDSTLAPEELVAVVDRIVADNPDKVEAYRGGREGLLGFFVGQVMRETRGSADPERVQELLRARLAG